MQFTDIVPSRNVSPGKNTCSHIVIHHTGGGSYKGNLRALSGNGSQVSCHFLLGRDGEIAKIGTPEQILRHAGESQWGKLKFMNRYAIGIEIVDDIRYVNTAARFTDKQRDNLKALVKHLANAYGIPEVNILTHASITRAGSKEEKLWDGKSKSRKVDADRQLWANKYENFSAYRHSFYL